jgi:hypothetical protein
MRRGIDRGARRRGVQRWAGSDLAGSRRCIERRGIAIVKDGSVGCNPGQQAYTFYSDVIAGQTLNFHAISHITYCKCPEEPNPLRQ